MLRIERVLGSRVEAHLAEIQATEPYTVPGSIFDEVAAVYARVPQTGAG